MTPPTTLTVRVNGDHAAWPVKLAGDGPRAAEVRRSPFRAANTSVSLIVRRADQLVLHVLVDVGLGVVNSLLELQESAGIDRVDALLLTHPHFDHVAGLDWLAASLSRSTVPGQPWPLPVYCTQECYRAIFEPPRLFHWLASSVDHRPLEAGVPVDAGRGSEVALTVTAVPVEHGPTAPGSAILALDYACGGERRRLGLAWDLLRLAKGADPSPLYDCDLLFVDSTTVHPQGDPLDPAGHKNWHISIEEALSLTRPWRPRRTYLIHYSGSHDEDPPAHDCRAPEVRRALTRHELAEFATRLGAEQRRDLRVADLGLLIPHHQAWPEPFAS